MRVDFSLWILAFLWGIFLGVFYFGGLWLTVSALPRKKRPKRWLAVSYVLRLAGALAGFWIIIYKGGSAFFFTLAAFFLVRVTLTRVLIPKNGEKDHAAQSR